MLAPGEIAAIFGKILGRSVRYHNAPLKLFLKVSKALGYADWVIAQLYWFLQDYQRNAFGVGAPTNAVLDVGGEPPEEELNGASKQPDHVTEVLMPVAPTRGSDVS